MFDTLSEKFSDAFKNLQGKAKISEKNIEDTLAQVKRALLEADVNFKVVKQFIAAVKEEAMGEKVIRGVNPEEQFEALRGNTNPTKKMRVCAWVSTFSIRIMIFNAEIYYPKGYYFFAGC